MFWKGRKCAIFLGQMLQHGLTKTKPSGGGRSAYFHWVCELVVDAVFCEPVSAAKSLLNREFTGNFSILGPIGADGI